MHYRLLLKEYTLLRSSVFSFSFLALLTFFSYKTMSCLDFRCFSCCQLPPLRVFFINFYLMQVGSVVSTKPAILFNLC